MIKVQKPTKEDIKGIQQVFYKTWLATYPNEEVGVTREDIKERFKYSLSENALSKRANEILDKSLDQLFIVAKDEAFVVGVCKVKKNKNYNELEAIYVLPDYQGKGIGKILWNSAKGFFGNKQNIIVSVATYNQQAINFYQKIGFVDTGKRFAKEKYRMPLSKTLVPEMEMMIDAKNL
ncbi:MAG: GNAT family N-acetyltransferase [Candidatus Moranbacteria bacterium]|jgi:ribosomal protein S18 acetylase RimI-like enzyme|nr:GNAT family N-acetyltransferase [Candidatus Moranbacteria bacterium]